MKGVRTVARFGTVCTYREAKPQCVPLSLSFTHGPKFTATPVAPDKVVRFLTRRQCSACDRERQMAAVLAIRGMLCLCRGTTGERLCFGRVKPTLGRVGCELCRLRGDEWKMRQPARISCWVR